MKTIMLYCFQAVEHKLKAKIGYFDLYGFDFLIDDAMKVSVYQQRSGYEFIYCTKLLYIVKYY